MRKIVIALLMASLFSCAKSNLGGTACGTHNGKTLYKGSNGGCYYINGSGNKEYVDRSECNC